MLFWRAYGKNGVGDTIRAEARTLTYYDKEKKEQVVLREFYTAEALIAHCESVVRKFFTMPDFGFKFVSVPQFATPMGGMPMLPPIFSFAIAYDATLAFAYKGTTSSSTTAHTVTGSNPLIVVPLDCNTGDTSAYSATYAGTTMASAGAEVAAPTYAAKCFILPNCATGANNIVVSWTGSKETIYGAVSYSGCKATGQPDAYNTAAALSASITTVVANCIGFSLAGTDGGNVVASTNVDNSRSTYGGGYAAYGDSNAIASPGSFTMTWTGTGPSNIIVFSIAPYVVSGPANLKTWDGLAKASIKTINGLAIASVKTVDGLA